MTKKSFTVLLLIVFTACNDRIKDTEWKDINIQSNNLFDIGSDPENITFSFPNQVAVDDSGKIYVADISKSEVNVFNQEGSYLYNIGRRGEGPGEFRNISGIGINPENNLVVFDGSNTTANIFTTNGDLVQTSLIPSTSPEINLDYLNGFPILQYLDDSNNSGDYLVHTYSKDFSQIISQSVSVDDISFTTNENLNPFFFVGIGSTLIKDQSLYVAPVIYNGRIFKYRYVGEDETFVFEKTITGKSFIEPVTFLSNESSISNPDMRISSREYSRRPILLHNRSIGLFELNTGDIVHFTIIEDANRKKRIFGAEIYDENFQAIGFGSIYEKELSENGSNLISWKITAKDKNDRFYIINREAEPVINVVSISY